jgi:hypothetical protein
VDLIDGSEDQVTPQKFKKRRSGVAAGVIACEESNQDSNEGDDKVGTSCITLNSKRFLECIIF